MRNPFAAKKAEISPAKEKFSMSAHTERLKFTPDAGRIDRKAFHLMFVYDGMKIDLPNYEKIRENSFSSHTAFSKDKFFLVKKKLGLASYPIMMDNPWDDSFMTRSLRVKGELHYIHRKLFNQLDTDKQNGLEFIRKKIAVLIPYSKIVVPSGRHPVEYQAVFGVRNPVVPVHLSHEIDVWTYVAINDFWEGLIDGGYGYSPVTIFNANRPEIGQYYSFEKKDYDD